MLTGVGIGVSWLVSVTIGMNALMDFQPLPIIGHLLGGAIGTYIGLFLEKRKQIKIDKPKLPNYLF
jgi:hypothetical protein